MILLNILAGLNSLFKVMVKYFLGEANFDQVLHIIIILIITLYRGHKNMYSVVKTTHLLISLFLNTFNPIPRRGGG